jgi:antitoxin MazE
MTHAILGRWGKNLAVRLPQEIASSLELHEGERVEIVPGPDHIVIRRAKPGYSLDAFFAGKSAEEWRTIYADAYDWGPEVGQEIVEE